jgi:AcrR family transcriptional regulator
MVEKALTSRKIKADKTKQKIYERAMRLFRKKGYDSVKIIDICKSAGVSVGTFYYYFKSKEDIVETGIFRHNEAMNRILDAYTPTDTISNIRYFICQQMKIVNQFNSEDLAIIYGYRLFLTVSGKFNIKQHTENISANDFLYKEVKSGVEQGLFRNDLTVDDIVETIRRQSRGCTYDWCLHKYNYDLLKTRMHDLDLMLEALMKK